MEVIDSMTGALKLGIIFSAGALIGFILAVSTSR